MDSHANFSYSTVATAPSPASSGTSLVVAAGDGAKFPAVPFNATIWPTGAIPLTTNAEIVRVTTVSTDTLTIVRAQEGSSARTVIVGDQIAATITTKTLTDAEQTVEAIITQASHGFVAGDVLRLSGTTYVKAQANSEANAEAVGIVSASVTSGIFRLVTHGKISGLTGLTAGTVYFLSQSSAGALTATEPTTVGQVSKPVLIADTTTSGWIFNMRGFVVSAAAGGGGLFDAYALLRDEKTAGTHGGAFSSGAWRTRVLNTELFDVSGIVSLSSDQFTLQAGTYFITARAPVYLVDAHQLRVQNITDGTTAIVGSSNHAQSNYGVGNHGFLSGLVTIAGAKAFELQHRCETSNGTHGFGVGRDWGDSTVGVFAEVEIWRQV